MAKVIVNPSSSLKGSVCVPGDKSLTHRAMLLGSLAKGTSNFSQWLISHDTLATRDCLMSLGVPIESNSGILHVQGKEYKKPLHTLDAKGSGTTMRLLMGLLCCQNFSSILDGNEQLRHRPMDRVVLPLQLMGAKIESQKGYAPLRIQPSELHGINYTMPVASAQVKSALILAGLFAKGVTCIEEKEDTRDHTERMLMEMGAKIRKEKNIIKIEPCLPLSPINMDIPGDFSSAAFLLTAGIVVEGSEIIIQKTDTNFTRTGLLDALCRMGAGIELQVAKSDAIEPISDLHVCSQALQGITIPKDFVPRMIDEFPIFMIAALKAQGVTIVRNATELRVKESDRISVMTHELKKMGARIEEAPDGFSLQGPQNLHGCELESHKDHRVAMSLIMAALIAKGPSIIHGIECIDDSFPGYISMLKSMGANLCRED